MEHHEKSSDYKDGHRLEIYKERYKHELLLNEHTAAFEHAAVRPAILLNGGAIVAFLTLIGSVWKSGTQPNLDLVGVALAIWCIGLVTSSVATGLGYVSQRAFTRMIRIQREALEATVLGKSISETSSSIKPEYAKATKYQRAAVVLIAAGLGAFLSGAFFAYISLRY